jgi:HD-GYP domain-containing protein (c-di-GMP phosphodiesterase class II)
MGGDEFCVLAEVEDDDGALGRLGAAALSADGDGFRIDCAYGVALLDGEADSAEDGLRLADQRMYEQKSAGRASASRQSADVLLTVLGERSRELDAHIADVAELSALTAERLGLTEADVRKVRLAAELHDVGKAAIPDAILNKPGKLSDDEWAFVRRHTLIGERIVRAAPSLAPAAEIVRATHERMDGGGYPDGPYGDEIPFGARIVAVCDAYDAIISDRPYRPGRTVNDAPLELDRCAGTQFDARIVKVVREVIAERDQRENSRAAA